MCHVTEKVVKIWQRMATQMCVKCGHFFRKNENLHFDNEHGLICGRCSKPPHPREVAR